MEEMIRAGTRRRAPRAAWPTRSNRRQHRLVAVAWTITVLADVWRPRRRARDRSVGRRAEAVAGKAPEGGATSTSWWKSSRALARTATAPPNENPASQSGTPAAVRIRMRDDRKAILGLAAALVVRSLASRPRRES
jgi:hypothetical protein